MKRLILICLPLLTGMAPGVFAASAPCERVMDKGFAVSASGVDNLIKECTEYIRKKPAAPIGYMGRAIAYGMKGDNDGKIADLTTAIDLISAIILKDKSAPKSSMSALRSLLGALYSDRGAAHLDKGEYDQAIADFSKFIEIDPKATTAYYDRGISYHRQGKFDQAISDLGMALDLSSAAYDPAEEASKKVQPQPDPGNYSAFMKHLERFHIPEIAGQRVDAYLARTLVYKDMGDFQKAATDCNTAILFLLLDGNRVEKSANLYYQCAVIDDLRAEYDWAIKRFTKAIEESYLEADSLNAKGTAASIKGDHATALVQAAKALRATLKVQNYEYARGLTYKKMRVFDKAIADFGLALIGNDKDVKVYVARGSAYEESGDLAHAEADYSKAIALDPSNQEAKEGLKRLGKAASAGK